MHIIVIITLQAEKQLHSGELTHREHQALLKELFNLHQFQRQQKDDQYIFDHPLDPLERRPYPGDPRNSHDPRHSLEKDIDHRRFPVQDIDMRVFDPSHIRIGSESSGKETTGSESEAIDQMQVGDKDERNRAALPKDRDDRVRDVPGEKPIERPSAPLKSILKTKSILKNKKKPVLEIESPMSPEPEEQKGNDFDMDLLLTNVCISEWVSRWTLDGRYDGRSMDAQFPLWILHNR